MVDCRIQCMDIEEPDAGKIYPEVITIIDFSLPERPGQMAFPPLCSLS